MRDLIGNILMHLGILPQNSSGGVVTSGDITRDLNYEEIAVPCSVGTVTGSPTNYSVVYQVRHKDVGGAYVNYGDAVTIDETDSATGDVLKQLFIDAKGMKAVFEVQATVSFTAGTTPAVDISAPVIYGEGKHLG